MMQRCSDLGNNPETWQELFRFGKNKLQVKKGPDGHYLAPECRDELQKSLPAKSFASLMSLVATWMSRLDEKDKLARRARETTPNKQKVIPSKELQSETPVEEHSEDNDSNEFIDLCSEEGEEKESIGEDEDSFDTDTVISQSSVIIIDDDLGEVNLKDFADHVEGKLDARTLRQRNRREENTVIPGGAKGPDALRRSLKTYEKKRKCPTVANGETVTTEAMATNEDPKILREVNREANPEAAQKLRKSDCALTADVNQSRKANKELSPGEFHPVSNGYNNNTLVAAANPQQQLQIVTEPTAYYNLAKASVEPKLKQAEPTWTTENKPNEVRKPEQEMHGDAKENEPKKGLHLEQAKGEPTKEAAPSEETLRNQRLEQDNHVPQIRIRTDLGPGQTDVIRVRTDLLHEQPPEQPSNPMGNQGPTAETLVPQGTAEKRRLPEDQSLSQAPKRPALESYNPQYGPVPAAPAVATSFACQPNIPPASINSYQRPPAPTAPPVGAGIYRMIAPRPPAPVATTTSSYSCQPNLSISSSHHHTPVNPPSVSHHHTPVNPSIASSSGFPTGSHQPINPANRPLVIHPPVNPVPPPPAASSNYSPIIPGNAATSAASRHSPVIPMINPYPPGYPYQPPLLPRPTAPVGTAMYPPGPPMAAAPPLPPSSYSQVPLVATAPATAMAGGAPPPVPPPASNRPMPPPTLDPRIDLANIMGMLNQVEMFAYRQENQEAFNLVRQLRTSLQRGAAAAYHR